MTKQKTEVAVIDFEKFSVAQLPELKGKKEEIKGIIDANPIVEIVDNSTYELAKKSRTAVRSLRTSLENEQKTVKKKIKEHVLDIVDAEYDTLVLGVKSAEQTRQEPITAWEDKKEQERLEKARLEQERIDGIKSTISLFKQSWETKISELKFEGIDTLIKDFNTIVEQGNRSIYQEFEVLFYDAISSLRNVLDMKIHTLHEQENIRLEQIRLAEERKKQEEEAKKIAEAQRLEREKFEAEQKAIAEKQRIAKEQFEKKKAEFEAKQSEAKFQDRCKQLVDLGIDMAIFELEHKGDVRWMNLKTSAKIESDSYWNETLAWVKLSIEARDKVKTDEIAQEQVSASIKKGIESEEKALGLIDNYHESDVDPKGIQKEVTWDSIYSLFQDQTQLKKDLSIKDAFDWLSNNYSVPAKKQ